MIAHELWREHGDGVWAVELTDGVVTGAFGPLDASEVDEAFLGAFDYAEERAAWMESHRDSFATYVPERPFVA